MDTNTNHQNHTKLKSLYKRKKLIIILFIALALIIAIFFILNRNKDNQDNQGQVMGESVKTVGTIIVGEKNELAPIEVSGIVKAGTKVDIVALNSGTVTNVYFDIGDTVFKGQALADSRNQAVLANFNSASTNFTNNRQSLDLTTQLLDQSIKQSETNLENAAEGVRSAQISYNSAKLSYENGQKLQQNNRNSTIGNGINTYNSSVSSLKNILNQINYIIKAEGSSQLPGIAPTLSVLNYEALYQADSSYVAARACLDDLDAQNPNQDIIAAQMQSVVNCYQLASASLEDTISVLNNTIPNPSFGEQALIAQRATYNNLRQSFTIEQASVQSTATNLANLYLSNQTELDQLKAALESADSRLESAKLNLTNAQNSLEQSKKNKQQQLLSLETSLAVASSQFEIASSALSDLSPKAPISGIITQKQIEPGTELFPGQIIGQISSGDIVKVVVDIPSEDVYKMKLGGQAIINQDIKASISSINPSADPISRKVKIELIIPEPDNLIPETFVGVSIPTDSPAIDNENQSNFILVPLKAVIISPNETYVFTIEDNIAQKTIVEIGEVSSEAVQILSGLKPGDQLVTSGNKNISAGDKITITP